MLETVGLLGRLSRFVIADLSDAKLVNDELLDIVPTNPSLPVQLIIQKGQRIPGKLKGIRARPNVLQPFRYRDIEHLVANLEKRVIAPVNEKAREIRTAGTPPS